MYRKLLYYLLFPLFLLVFFPSCQTAASGYIFHVNLKGNTDADSLSLRKLEDGKSIVIQTVKINSGKAVFSGHLPLKPGWYTAGTGKKAIFDILVSDTLQQHFDISAAYGKIPATLSFENSPENTAFADYQRFLDDCSKQQRTLLLRYRDNNWSPDSVRKIDYAGQQLNTKMEEQAEMLKKNFPGSMLALYIGLSQRPRVPEPVVPSMVTDRNRYMQDYYSKYMTDHFLDEIDFSDNRIVTIPGFQAKLRVYLFQMTEPVREITEPRIETVMEKAGVNDDVYRFTAKLLYRMFRESALPFFLEESVFIGEKYILNNTGRWKDSFFVDNVREKVTKARLNPIGSVATDLKLTTPDGKFIRLSEVKAHTMILYFFNPECEACISITEKLSLIWQKLKNQEIVIFAVYLEQKPEVWKQFVNSDKREWVHVWDPTGEEQIEKKYDIYALPMIYLLDQNKKIIAKDVPVEKLEEFIRK
jgi:thiol-disulfide isomerase/thioredoxin